MKYRSSIVNFRRFYVLVMAAFLVIAGASIYFLFVRDNNVANKPKAKLSTLKNEAPGPPATAAQLESKSDKISKKLLLAKDYASYQVYERGLANQYLGQKDYAKADRIMGLVRTNVPPADIQANSLTVMVDAAKGKKDTAKTKEYLGKAIDALNKEGRAEESAVYAKELEAMN